MKIKSRTITVVSFIAVFIIHAVLIGCATDISDNEISIRKQSLFEEKNMLPDKGEYAHSSPGESKKIARAFENSPPLIPHDITDMLPITADDNMCMQCHMPDAAEGSDAVAIPRSHFMELATGKDHGNALRGERHACMLCHVPQAGLPATVDNTFKEEFRDEESRHNSNLSDILNEGVK